MKGKPKLLTTQLDLAGDRIPASSPASKFISYILQPDTLMLLGNMGFSLAAAEISSTSPVLLASMCIMSILPLSAIKNSEKRACEDYFGENRADTLIVETKPNDPSLRNDSYRYDATRMKRHCTRLATLMTASFFLASFMLADLFKNVPLSTSSAALIISPAAVRAFAGIHLWKTVLDNKYVITTKASPRPPDKPSNGSNRDFKKIRDLANKFLG